MFVQYKIAYVHYYIHKVFGVVSSHRDASIANSCSDVALPGNTLIPSYSEAMRMDRCGRTESTELLTRQPLASTANVEVGSGSDSTALVPLLQGFQRPRSDRTRVIPASAVVTGRTVYGTVVYDRAGHAFFRSAACHPRHRAPVPVHSWSNRDSNAAAPVGLRSRRRDAVQKRKRRRSYNEAVGAPSGSETSLAVNRLDLPDSALARAQQRGKTFGRFGGASVCRMTTSVSTPESFDKLQNASALITQLRHVKSFVEGGIRPSTNEAGNDDAANVQSSSVALGSPDRDHVTAVPANVRSELGQSAYDVVGRRVVRCQQDWIDHVVDDDDDDDLPPSYEDALRMRVAPYDMNIQLDDISSVSTTSTYLSSEAAVGDTPRRWKACVRRPYAIVDLPPLHVETSL